MPTLVLTLPDFTSAKATSLCSGVAFLGADTEALVTCSSACTGCGLWSTSCETLLAGAMDKFWISLCNPITLAAWRDCEVFFNRALTLMDSPLCLLMLALLLTLLLLLLLLLLPLLHLLLLRLPLPLILGQGQRLPGLRCRHTGRRCARKARRLDDRRRGPR